MRSLFPFLTVVIFFVAGSAVDAQDIFSKYESLFTTPRHYVAERIEVPVNIDGRLDESAWGNATWSEYFVDIEGDKKKAPAYKTRFKILWDSEHMYVGVEMEEPHVWANIKQHDAVIYYDNDMEIFLDPDGDTHNYFELELNAHNTVFDLFMPRPYRDGGSALHNWDVKKLRSAVAVRGTINNANDTDTAWYVELAIPFQSVSLGSTVQVPRAGVAWRINFSRVQWDVDIVNDRHVKRVNKSTGRVLPEHNWVWSQQGVINMHFPERWGYLYFSDSRSGTIGSISSETPSDKLKKTLWLLYYKQKDYYRQHKKYASSLRELQMPVTVNLPGVNGNLYLEATTRQFNANIHSAGEKSGWQINQEGRINKFIQP